jgi:site-specific DNA recombinase
MTTLAAIYSRISHDPEGRQAGVEWQEQDCRQMAAERGWTVLEPVYRENDTSASTRSRKRRPVFEQLLQDVEHGAVQVLLAYSTSRLTRRPLEYERLIELTSRTGLEIHTVVSGPVPAAHRRWPGDRPGAGGHRRLRG